MWEDLIGRMTGLDDIESISYSKFGLRHSWSPAILFLLIVAAVAFSAWSYAQLKSTGRRFRVAMGTLRALSLILFLVLFFEPVLNLEFTRRLSDKVLVLIDSSESMSITDAREDQADIEEAAVALGMLSADGTGALEIDLERIAAASRFDLAKGILNDPKAGLLRKLAAEHDVRLFHFAERLEPVDDDGGSWKALRDMKPEGRFTALGSAIQQATERYGGQAIAGVAVISDFSWNQGAAPLEVAMRLKDRGIPIYTVGVGLVDPPDVSLTGIYSKKTLFVNDKYSVKVQVKTTPGFAGRAGELTLSVNDVKQETRMIVFKGDFQVEEFRLTAPAEPGDYKIEVNVTAMDEEAVTDNNMGSRDIRVIDEKVKVLYVAGMPRWEYRYLRWVLLRDPRLDVKFLMTQGDSDLAAYSYHHLSRFPEAGKTGLDFDLVILGDVPATYFNAEQFRWIEELVKRRGGALLMIAGTLYAPSSYGNTAIADLLPVTIEQGSWKTVSRRETPVVTSAGLVSEITKLSDDPARDKETWKRMRPLHSIPAVSAKPGATILMALSNLKIHGEPYPLLAWQRYGSGKTMFVGSEKLWRIRFKVGRKYHERLWAQTIQFLTLSRLQAGNRRVTIETDRRAYAVGEQAQVFANVLDRFLEPVRAEEYILDLALEDDPHTAEKVRLSPVAGVPGFYQGYVIPRKLGRHVLKAPVEDREFASPRTFDVKDVSLEMRSPGLQIETARSLAELSGGKAIMSARDLDDLVRSIRAQTPVRVERMELEVWDTPPLYILLVLFTGIEWFFRRKRRLI